MSSSPSKNDLSAEEVEYQTKPTKPALIMAVAYFKVIENPPTSSGGQMTRSNRKKPAQIEAFTIITMQFPYFEANSQGLAIEPNDVIQVR